jgi:glycosyltransferase involved in cell wall biosynthesis
VDEGRSGFVLDAPDDAEAVAAALRALLADPGQRRALGETARERARERFSMEVRAATLADLWRRLARA